MMVDDMGGGFSFRDPKDKTIYEKSKTIDILEARLKDAEEELAAYRAAPLRRMWTAFKEFWCEWFGVFLILAIVACGVGGAMFGSNYRTKKEHASCEFAAKIQETKFEFDTYNEKCYLYDKKFEKYIPYATKAP